jgi:branched-chain amino acid aminotransferase
MLTPTEKIWFNGKFINWDDAKLHVLSHVVSYGSSVFEGIRVYSTPSGPKVFRLREHVRRLLDSAKIYRMDGVSFSIDQLSEAMLELVRVNQLDACYIRPILLRGYGDVGVMGSNNPLDIYIACWEWGKYLGEEALAEGVDVCISSWTRIAPNTLPALAKAGANYMNSQLIRSGTAAEITPIRSVDRIQIGTGRRGPVADVLQKEFFGIISGERPDVEGWLTPIHAPSTVGV